MNPYPEYKSTDLDWLPRVPAHWEVKKIQSFAKVKSVRNRPEATLLSVYRDYGVIIKSSRDDNHNAESEDLSNYKFVEVGDLVLNKMKTWQGSLAISPHEGIVSPAYIVCQIKGDWNRRFLHLLLRTPMYIGVYNAISYGVRIGQWDMRWQDFKQVPALVPPLDEQAQIVRYLGAKHREIESYIAAKRSLLARLKELSAATISRAVTRGLNPDVAVKPSGVEWLGDVPEHWEVKRLKFVVDYVSRGNAPTYAIESDIRAINQACVYPNGLRLEKCKFQSPEVAEGIENWKGFLHPNDVLINSTGTGTLGRVALFEEVEGIYFADGHVTIARDSKERINPRYLVRMLSILQDWITAEASVGATNQIELVKDRFRNLKIPLPPIREQAAIVNELEDQLAIIGEARTRIEREIILAGELYQTLVANVVTGQFDVSLWQGDDDEPQFVDELPQVDDELSEFVDELSEFDDEL